MKMNRKTLAKMSGLTLGVGIIITLLSCLVYFRQSIWYDVKGFKGQAEISDRGWRYPRYFITFDEIDLCSSREYEFAVKGMPPTELTFEFLLRGRFEEQVLKNCKAHLSVSIIQDGERVVLSFSGPVKEWLLSRSAIENNLWHPDGRDIPFSPRKTYTIRIEVSATEMSSTSLRARPILRGGGIELP
jgi:hypothetical protein